MATLEETKWAQRVIGTKDDGNFGPLSVTALVGFLRRLEANGDLPTHPGTPDAIRRTTPPVGTPLPAVPHPGMSREEWYRARVVDWARAQVSTTSKDPAIYWAHVCPAFVGLKPDEKAWCGGFALCAWKLNVPACKDWMWKDGVGFVGPHKVPLTTNPQPGDVVYWPTLDGRKISHYAIFVRAEGDTIYTIDGNQGISPLELVLQRDRSRILSKPFFYSLKPFVQ